MAMGDDRDDRDRAVSSCGMSARRSQAVDLVLRSLGLFGTIVAALLMARNSQTLAISQTEASYSQFVAFRYFLVANVVVFGYALLSLSHSLAGIVRGRAYSTSMFLRGLFDMIAVAILASAVGAAAATGQVAWKGNSNYDWIAICSSYGTFCRRIMLALICSTTALFLFFILGTVTLITVFCRLIL